MPKTVAAVWLRQHRGVRESAEGHALESSLGVVASEHLMRFHDNLLSFDNLLYFCTGTVPESSLPVKKRYPTPLAASHARAASPPERQPVLVVHHGPLVAPVVQATTSDIGTHDGSSRGFAVLACPAFSVMWNLVDRLARSAA
jgi:hypothetical protein